ncbi:MAG: DUF354 domain-containing protein [Candidatus Heimdallarchaeaceae archaeon]
MLIWFDAVTAKEPLLFDAIAKELEKEGHEVIFTCREYDYVSSLFKLLGRKVEVFGKHGGKTLYGKLIAGNERIKLLAKYINNLNKKLDKKPDYHICFGCPESTRVAFGLGIPVININDSPHAWAVAKLTVPLSKYLVYSGCIKEEEWLKLGAVKEQLCPYNGIDEVAWLKSFEPNEEVLSQLGLSKEEHFIVARPEESSAAYMLDDNITSSTYLDVILDEILKTYKGKVVVFPRYQKQKKLLQERYKEKIIVPPKAVDTLSLYYYADLCISGGATMARESAAIGTPAISYFPRELDVLKYISETGIPLYNEYTISDAIKRAKELLSSKSIKDKLRQKTKSILSQMESPVDKVIELIKN